jgi:hypothetical protein
MGKKNPPNLTEEEIDILVRGRKDPDIITNYFFRPEGFDHGWTFDANFDPEGAWQKTVHQAAQRRIVVIGGFGSGKTRGIAISACTWAMTTTDFAFLNAAPKAWQSELMYRFVLDISRGTPFEKLIYESPKRPYPKIELRFYVRNMLIVSTLEFMSVDKNANQILSWEGDWVNIDEAGLLDNLGETIRNLGSRLRGTVKERPRLGRMSLTTNSWDNPELWYRYDLAVALPEDYLSITVSTRHNHNVTPQQLKDMLRDIPEDEHQRFIEGGRPEGRGSYFSKSKVYACEDEFYAKFIEDRVEQGRDGWDLQSIAGAGIIYFRTPPIPGNYYMLLGDPGTDEPPNRNAPVLMVWDVSEFPKARAQLSAFWWGSGYGSITPFINRLLTFMADYNPVFTAVDSTGPQKNTATLLNTYLSGSRTDENQRKEWLGNVDLSHVTYLSIGGMDFSGSRKPAYLVAGRLMLEAGLLAWPKNVIGIRSQLTNYDPDKDRVDQPKIAQDIVATLCMSAYAIRSYFQINPADYMQGNADNIVIETNLLADRSQRLAVSDRDRSNLLRR